MFSATSIRVNGRLDIFVPPAQAKFEDVPKRPYSVLPMCFFAFSVAPAEVADTDLINAKIALAGNFGAHFHFDSKIIRSQTQ
jgi:hypothetical protein